MALTAERTEPSLTSSSDSALEFVLGITCRLRSRYLPLSVRNAARRNDYSTHVSLGKNALGELAVWALVGNPERPTASCWACLWSADWSKRAGRMTVLPASALVANNGHCFFGSR